MAAELPPDEARQSTHNGILKHVLIPSFILIGIAAVVLRIIY